MTLLPADHVSYWMDSTGGTSHPPLPPKSELKVDVAVVGGGVAGLSTAWELVRAGRSVAVLEADRVAAGVSGYTTAKLSSLHGLVYARLRRSRGAEAAKLYARSQQEAVERVVEVAAELGADCELEHAPAYAYSESAEGADEVRAEAEAAREAGLAASFVTETGLPFPVAGAVRVEHQAQFHPRKYLLALVSDLAARGAHIHERSRVVGLREGDGGPCRVTTENGASVVARDVVVATHYPVFDRALLFARLEPRRELAVAAVIPSGQDPEGMYITPEDNTRSVRTAPYGEGRRLLIVTGEKFPPGGENRVEERFERLADWAAERFPGAEIAYRWATQDNFTADHVPYVGPFHPGAKHVHVATGYGGWGLSGGVMTGRLLTAYITGTAAEVPWADLYDPRRLHPVLEAGPMIKLQATVARHFIVDRLRPSHVDSVEEIAPGTGALVRVNGQRHGVYRDDTGAVHAVSARCTHLGCLVHFNDAERAWECPCHGSRFGTDGSVLQGPATRPLERRDLPAPD